MTECKSESSRRPSRAASSVLLAFLMLLLILFLAKSEQLNLWMRQSLTLCTTVLIPSLFPFLVLSDLLLRSGSAERLGHVAARPFRILFGISEAGVAATVLGMLCGFPIGARMAISLYEQGTLERDETERLIGLCSVPSPAFLIGTVGISMLKSRALGTLLYAVNLLSAALICMANAYLSKRKSPPAQTIGLIPDVHTRPYGLRLFSSSIANSVTGMLHVCAFVLAFSCIIRLIGMLMNSLPFSIPSVLTALLFGALELTGGISFAATLPPRSALLACALISGWSGLSVHMQIISLTGNRPLSFRRYFCFKLCCAALNCLLVGILILCNQIP